jgi:hypothetical protein
MSEVYALSFDSVKRTPTDCCSNRANRPPKAWCTFWAHLDQSRSHSVTVVIASGEAGIPHEYQLNRDW